MMTDTCGPTWLMPFAYYDPDTSSVRTSQATFPWDSTPSSPTLPPWGSMRGGELFARPTPAPLTAARGSSSSQLIGTPTAQSSATGRSDGPVYDPTSGKAPNPVELAALLPTPLANMNGPSQAEIDGGNPYRRLETEIALLSTPVADHSRGLPQPGTDYQSLPNVAVSLLPTPAVNDMGRGKTAEQWDEWTAKMQASHSNGNGHGKSLEIEAQRLLPTPTAHQHPAADTRDPHQRMAGPHQTELSDVARAGFPTSAPTLPPSPDGNSSPDDQHLLPLNLDGTTDPG